VTSHTISCCWLNPSFGNKIDPKQQSQSETSSFWWSFERGKTFCNQNVGDGKCERRWLWGGVAPSHWLAALLLLPVWVNYIFYSPSHLQHSTKNNSLNANQIMEDVWHIDALGDRVVGQPSTPFDLRIILYYGDSCGYGAVHWIPDTLRNRGTLSMSTF